MKASSTIVPRFTGFPDEGLTFLRELADNQNKAWMTEHKPVYERAVWNPLASLVSEVTDRFASANVPLKGDPKRSIFRINRDVRFSHDKRPYKTHAGAVWSRTGDKNVPGLLYIHIDPAQSFMAAGFFRPESDMLYQLREYMVNNQAAWHKIESSLETAKLPLDRSDILTRLPRGFDGPYEGVIEQALKLKSWIVRHKFSNSHIAKSSFTKEIVEFAGKVMPLLEFGWSALEDATKLK